MKFKSAFATAAALLCAAPVFADWSQDGDYPWGKLDDKTVTQHRKLYKPLSGKKPKIFSLVTTKVCAKLRNSVSVLNVISNIGPQQKLLSLSSNRSR